MQFANIQIFREWSIGHLGQSKRAGFPEDFRKLGNILNRLEHSDTKYILDNILQRFLPRYEGLSTSVEGDTVQIFLHEQGLKTPVPAARLSDGTVRFLAMAALLLMPDPPPLVCIEEPELGLHPDTMTLLAELFMLARERTQLIVTTHSDALLSALTEEVESVLVCEYLEGTVFSRLELDKLKYWLDKYRLGDLWRMGDLGGNP